MLFWLLYNPSPPQCLRPFRDIAHSRHDRWNFSGFGSCLNNCLLLTRRFVVRDNHSARLQQSLWHSLKYFELRTAPKIFYNRAVLETQRNPGFKDCLSVDFLSANLAHLLIQSGHELLHTTGPSGEGLVPLTQSCRCTLIHHQNDGDYSPLDVPYALRTYIKPKSLL